MRIFGGFNYTAAAADGSTAKVSIRHADFRWFQPPRRSAGWLRITVFQSAMRIFGGFNVWCHPFAVLCAKFQSAMRIFGGFNQPACLCPACRMRCFNPPCGFSVVSTQRMRAKIDRDGGFNPPCGFSVVSTRAAIGEEVMVGEVSIRHADFRWFQRMRPGSSRESREMFQSAMRIFGGFNRRP